jgi:hypothetical protein
VYLHLANKFLQKKKIKELQGGHVNLLTLFATHRVTHRLQFAFQSTETAVEYGLPELNYELPGVILTTRELNDRYWQLGVSKVPLPFNLPPYRLEYGVVNSFNMHLFKGVKIIWTHCMAKYLP